MFNDHDYFAQAMIDQRRAELDRQLARSLHRRQAREQAGGDTDVPTHRRAGRLRVALGTLLVKLGAALIGCETHARAALKPGMRH